MAVHTGLKWALSLHFVLSLPHASSNAKYQDKLKNKIWHLAWIIPSQSMRTGPQHNSPPTALLALKMKSTWKISFIFHAYQSVHLYLSIHVALKHRQYFLNQNCPNLFFADENAARLAKCALDLKCSMPNQQKLEYFWLPYTWHYHSLLHRYSPLLGLDWGVNLLTGFTVALSTGPSLDFFAFGVDFRRRPIRPFSGVSVKSLFCGDEVAAGALGGLLISTSPSEHGIAPLKHTGTINFK